MAFNEGGMASGLLIIAVSIVFAAGFGFPWIQLPHDRPSRRRRLGATGETRFVHR